MDSAASRATLVLCAPWDERSPVSHASDHPAITWLATPEAITRAATVRDGASLALDLSADVLADRLVFRRLVRLAGRVTGLRAAVLDGIPDREQRRILVDHGIAVAVVRRLQEGRGGRRPPPRGWRCRSALWGLWEVVPAARGGLTGWLGLLPRPAPGSLHVVVVGRHGTSGRLPRWTAWADRWQHRGRALAIPLGALGDAIGGDGRQPRAASVLRAA